MSISRTERFDRTLRLIGDSAMERLHNARVTVAGLGAVGSYAVEGLARAGVGNLCVIDFDHVEPSNINRQLYALESTLGQAKTDLCVKRIHDINPDCNVTPMNLFITQESVSEVIDPAPDILIDAIDSLNAKVTLIVSAIEAGIVVCSSMGAARRMDTTKIRIADISKTRHCPLARFVRKRLRRRGIHKGVTCVYSDETTPPPPQDAPEECTIPGKEQAGRRGRALKISSYLDRAFTFDKTNNLRH